MYNRLEFSIRSVAGAFLETAERHGQVIILATLAMTAFDALLFLALGDRQSFAISNIASMVLTFFVLRHVLRHEGLVEEEGGFSAYFGASVLSGLGILAGLLLLVVPGLYLVARWAVAPSLVITRNMRATEAMSASWEATAHVAWTVVGIYVAGFCAAFLPAMAIGAGLGVMGFNDSLVSTIVISAVTDLAAVLSAFLNVAIYRLLVLDAAEQDVFA